MRTADGPPDQGCKDCVSPCCALSWRQQEDFETAERGKVADLVLLDADPLVDIRNTQKIQAVVLNGRLLDRQALGGMLSRLEASAPNQ